MLEQIIAFKVQDVVLVKQWFTEKHHAMTDVQPRSEKGGDLQGQDQ